jgi:shikimate dehydrogenase
LEARVQKESTGWIIWEFTMIRGAVLGSPITHSLSPRLHRALFEYLKIDGSYEAIEVKSGELSRFFSERSEEFDYLSLTMPLKEEALSLGLPIDSIATRIQSANTLYKDGANWKVTSTDGSGFMQALKEKKLETFSSVLILGAGGTARAVAGVLDSVSKAITVLGRSSTREEALAQAVQVADFKYELWRQNIGFDEYDLVVNTTPAGAADLLAENVQNFVSAPLFDVIYNPWPTVLASRWLDSSGVVINGLEILLYQGIDQVEKTIGEISYRTELASHLRKVINAN